MAYFDQVVHLALETLMNLQIFSPSRGTGPSSWPALAADSAVAVQREFCQRCSVPALIRKRNNQTGRLQGEHGTIT